MAEYFIEKSARGNGDHVIHKSDCSLLPASKEAIQYLGSISSCSGAIKKASERFKQINGCSQCNPSFHVA